MATKLSTIRIGSFTKAVTKASSDRESIIAAAIEAAAGKDLIVLVKRDFAGRWQGWAKRATARGAAFDRDYRPLKPGILAQKHDLHRDGGQVWLADTAAGCGEVEAEQLHPAL